jgi:hypothetical protein
MPIIHLHERTHLMKNFPAVANFWHYHGREIAQVFATALVLGLIFIFNM